MLETRYEFLKLLRLPHYLVGTLGFPVMFYLLFGVSLAQKSDGPIGAAEYLIASYCIFGVVTAALFAFGVGVAVRARAGLDDAEARDADAGERLPRREDHLRRCASALIILILMGLCAVTMAHVRFPVSVWLTLWAVMALGCIPFCLGGLIIAFTVPPTGAPGIVNLINLPLSFAGGLWFPVAMMPKFLQAIAPWCCRSIISGSSRSARSARSTTPKPLQHVAALVAYARDLRRACLAGVSRRSDVNQ